MARFKAIALGMALAIVTLSSAGGLEPGANRGAGEQSQSSGLPAEAVTSHVLTINGVKRPFTARAGAIRLSDATSGAPLADVAYTAYELSNAEAPGRPLVFVFNGGPGAGSAWLGLGAVSPWRLRFPADAPSPSAPPALTENAESWLAFADLVLIDPPGSGYSKILADGDEAKRRFFSVEGDAEALATAIRKWIVAHGRLASPKYIAGESYGGFRAIKLLAPLRSRENIGVAGLFLVSPVLDFAWTQEGRNLLSSAALLPSMSAVARGARSRAELSDVEAYAAGDYVVALLKGVKDERTLAQLSDDVARFTGLDRQYVAQLGGRVDARSFSRAHARSRRRVSSLYDGQVENFDPAPFAPVSDWADPLLQSWRAPLGAAMTLLMKEKLNWPIGDARYLILGDQAARQWDYGHGGRASAEAVSDLQEALALDAKLQVVVLHGVADLVTPYFASKLLLDQFPSYGDADRLRLVVTRGGHMPYLYDESRELMRDEARRLVGSH